MFIRLRTNPSHPLWALAGLVALGLGVLGIFLPILPTTPLVLLAAFCFGKGSPRLRAWIMGHKRFGPMIDDWNRTGAIPRRGKRAAILAMVAALGLSFWMALPGYVIAIQILCLCGAGTFILTRPDA